AGGGRVGVWPQFQQQRVRVLGLLQTGRSGDPAGAGVRHAAYDKTDATPGGPVPLVFEFDLRVQRTAECLDATTQGVDLGALDTTPLDARHPVLTDVEPFCEVDLGQDVLLTQSVDENVFQHPTLVLVHRFAIDGSFVQHVPQAHAHHCPLTPSRCSSNRSSAIRMFLVYHLLQSPDLSPATSMIAWR